MSNTSAYRALLAAQQSLQLATCNLDGTAEISYAPFLLHDNRFYIYVSALAKHTGNLLRNHQAGIMLIQPEAEAENIFARQRLSFNCRVSEIHRNSAEYATLLELMRQRFGEIIELLASLPDFHLLSLQPVAGQYVAGFGKAQSVDLSLALA